MFFIHPCSQIVVQLDPRVQPDVPVGAAHSDQHHMFTMGHVASPVHLRHGRYYVLRLPYVYVRPDGHSYAPLNDDKQTSAGRILRNMVKVIEVDPDDDK